MTESKQVYGDWRLWGWGLLLAMTTAIALAGFLIHFGLYFWPDAILQQYRPLGGTGDYRSADYLTLIGIGLMLFLVISRIAIYGTTTVSPPKRTWLFWLQIIILILLLIYIIASVAAPLFGADQLPREIKSLQNATLTIAAFYYSSAQQAWWRIKLLRGSLLTARESA